MVLLYDTSLRRSIKVPHTSSKLATRGCCSPVAATASSILAIVPFTRAATSARSASVLRVQWVLRPATVRYSQCSGLEFDARCVEILPPESTLPNLSAHCTRPMPLAHDQTRLYQTALTASVYEEVALTVVGEFMHDHVHQVVVS